MAGKGQEHDKHLREVMHTLRERGLRLNLSKCRFRKRELEFLGHVFTKDSMKPHGAKVQAILDLAPPTDVTELRQIMGTVNFLGKYVPHLSSVAKPITDLLCKDRAWTWDSPQQQDFEDIKTLITQDPVLAYYDPTRPTQVSADSSRYGIGGVLMQLTAGHMKPVAFVSRTLNAAESRYAQIEKEALALVWTCEKFHRYLCGLPSFDMVTDHKPLIPLINDTDIDRAPLRCQRLLLRFFKYNPVARHVPGKQMVIADMLSRHPLPRKADESDGTHQGVQCHEILAKTSGQPQTAE